SRSRQSRSQASLGALRRSRWASSAALPMPPVDFLSDFLSACLRLSVPLAFAAIGGLFSERSGVLNYG
ncbi:MAG: hypothetical protein ACFB14_25875, partial [Leptolyngbyaceae cyanobacterium]